MINCRNCEKEFEPKPKHIKTCSDECFIEFNDKITLEAPYIIFFDSKYAIKLIETRLENARISDKLKIYVLRYQNRIWATAVGYSDVKKIREGHWYSSVTDGSVPELISYENYKRAVNA